MKTPQSHLTNDAAKRLAARRAAFAGSAYLLICIVSTLELGCAESSRSAVERLVAAGATVDTESGTKEGHPLATVTFEENVPDLAILRYAQQVGDHVWVTFQKCTITARMLDADPGARCALGLGFHNCSLAPGALAALDANPAINSLQFLDTPLDDDLLAGLDGLPKLRGFYMQDANLPRSAVRLLASAANLVSLTVANSDLDDRALCRITDAQPRLEVLAIDGTKVTDAAMPSIGRLAQLRRLGLNRCEITDDGARHLSRLKQLEVLGLSYTRISDAAVPSLEGLQRLRELHIAHTNVGDASLVVLAELQDLSELYAAGTQITQDEANAALPRVPVVVLGK
jgi:hypothetical protein